LDFAPGRRVMVWAFPWVWAGQAWLQKDTDTVVQALSRYGGLMALDWSDSVAQDDLGYDRLISGLQQTGITMGSIEHLLSGFLAALPTYVLEQG